MQSKCVQGWALSTWFATWSAEVINTFRVRESGRTSYELMTGHQCKHVIVGFGGKVFFQHTKGNKDEYRKDIGVFLGVCKRQE